MEERDRELEKLQDERDDYLEGWKRARADLVNYKKEEAARMERMAEYAEQELLIKVFPILDNVERAAKQIPDKEKNNQIYKGFLQIAKQWNEFLKSQGVEKIESLGKPFDPEVHEAVDEVEAAEGEEPGIVAEELEKGYMVNGRLLRPAKVKVTR